MENKEQYIAWKSVLSICQEFDGTPENLKETEDWLSRKCSEEEILILNSLGFNVTIDFVKEKFNEWLDTIFIK